MHPNEFDMHKAMKKYAYQYEIFSGLTTQTSQADIDLFLLETVLDDLWVTKSLSRNSLTQLSITKSGKEFLCHIVLNIQFHCDCGK